MDAEEDEEEGSSSLNILGKITSRLIISPAMDQLGLAVKGEGGLSKAREEGLKIAAQVKAEEEEAEEEEAAAAAQAAMGAEGGAAAAAAAAAGDDDVDDDGADDGEVDMDLAGAADEMALDVDT